MKCVGRTSLLVASLLAGTGILAAADHAGNTAEVSANTATQNDEIARLKAAINAQQQQLQSLQQTLQSQQTLLEQALGKQTAETKSAFQGLGQVASTTPMIPVRPLPAVAFPGPVAMPQSVQTAANRNPCEAPVNTAVPPYLRLGDVCIVPVGFMDLTSVWRDKNAGSGMGSNFGSVPYNNTVNGNLSEFRFTPQNSRIGFRIDGDLKGMHFIGYNEFDFNGTSGSNGISVSNGAFVPRLRLFWVDVRKNKLEFLAGQSWSMMTPNRRGISALPGDLFYTQVTDINYMAGLTWTRQPGMRILYHPTDKVTFGFSVENPDQYAGGSAGGSGITLPAAFASLANSQLDVAQNVSSGQNILNQPTLTPDFIAKVAFDPSSRFHFEVGGVNSNFKIVNPSVLTQHFTKSGGGVLVGLNAEVIKGLRVISTNYWSEGGGRYLFGQAPDLIVRSNGSLSLIKSGGTIDGFEETIKNTLLYAYYGGIYIGRNTGLDANGTTKIGYGYAGSPNSQNRLINELTFGFNQTIWKNARYGAVNLMGQYEWLQRNPWSVATGAPKSTHDNTIYVNIRYTLPGTMPNF
ncbi:MAG: hypothetical protein M3N93_03200 [Acidobacteriota bacterium]|nr:hypothetical protein [Acidobacteriota bacterium]